MAMFTVSFTNDFLEQPVWQVYTEYAAADAWREFLGDSNYEVVEVMIVPKK